MGIIHGHCDSPLTVRCSFCRHNHQFAVYDLDTPQFVQHKVIIDRTGPLVTAQGRAST
jgi:hypothetical protein